MGHQRPDPDQDQHPSQLPRILNPSQRQSGVRGSALAGHRAERALARVGTFPQFSRGVVIVSMAVANALGATSMSDITLLAQLAPVLGAGPSGSTVRRVPGLAGARTLARIAQARARIRVHV